MIKIVKLKAVGKRETGRSKKSDKVWTKVSATFEVVGQKDEIVASRFQVETDEIIKEIETMEIGKSYAVKFRHESREYNGKWYYSMGIEKVTKNEIDKPLKYNRNLHYITGVIYQILNIRTYDNAAAIDFLMISGTGTILKLSYYTSDLAKFEEVKPTIIEGAIFTVGVKFAIDNYEENQFATISIITMNEIKSSKKTEEKIEEKQAAPVSEPENDDNDELPF